MREFCSGGSAVGCEIGRFVAPLLHDRLLHFPGVGLCVDADLLRDLDAVGLRHKSTEKYMESKFMALRTFGAILNSRCAY